MICRDIEQNGGRRQGVVWDVLARGIVAGDRGWGHWGVGHQCVRSYRLCTSAASALLSEPGYGRHFWRIEDRI